MGTEKSFRVFLLEKDGDMQTIILPNAHKGHYFFKNSVSEDSENIVHISGSDDKWIAACLDKFYFSIGKNPLGKKLSLSDQTLVNVTDGVREYVLYVEIANESKFVPYYLEPHNDILIGRLDECDISYPNSMVSGEHARMYWQNDNWMLEDCDSKNGVYLNGHRVKEREKLTTGDIIYIMGLYIMVGVGFIAMNNEDGRVRVNSPKLHLIRTVSDVYYSNKEYRVHDGNFDRVIRSCADLSADDIEIELPPMQMNANKMPLMLRMGNQFLMGGRSIATGNVFGAVSSMLMPSLTQGFTEKERKEYEARRKEVYEDYLRRKEIEIAEEKLREEELLEYLYPNLDETLKFSIDKKRLWERRKFDSDFLTVRIGNGDVPMLAKIVYQKRKLEIEDDPLLDDMYKLAERNFCLNNAPVLLNLKENYISGININDERKNTVINNIIFQIVETHSYDEVKIVVLTEPESRQDFDYIRYLPHNWDNNKTIRFYCENLSDTQQISKYLNKQLEDIEELKKQRGSAEKRFPAYIIIATNKSLYDSIECLKDLQESDEYSGFSIIAAFKGMPKECTRIIEASKGMFEYKLDCLNDAKNPVVCFNLDVLSGTVDSNLREIMCTKLNVEGMKYSLPNMITFLDLFGAGKVEHLNPLKRWKENNPVKSLETPLGVGTDGKKFLLDLHEKHHGPHGLIAGGTGSGKSEFIITYILSMAVNYSPDEVAFILIDYKGGGLTDAFVSEKKGIHLPHVVGTITNLDGSAISRSLMSINSELKRRQTLFKNAKGETDEGTMDIYDYQKLYRNGKVSQPLPHLFIISDEFAELKKQQPEFMDELISTARIGRSLGVHLILATQKPTGVVDDQIWSNTKFRICLRVANKSDSMEMLKRAEAAEIRNTGRFYLQVGYNEIFALGQSAWCGADYQPSDEIITEVDQSVSFIDNTGQTIIEAKPKREIKESEGKQIVAIVKYLSDLAKSENIKSEQLWKNPLETHIDWDAVNNEIEYDNTEMKALIGVADDPEHQDQFPFCLDMLSFRNMFICGNSGSGKSTFIKTMLYSLIYRHSPEEFNYYIVDLSGGTLRPYSKLPHCGAYLTEENENDYDRLINMMKEIVAKRKTLFAEAEVTTYEAYRKIKKMPLILFVIDGYTNINSFSNGSFIHSTFYENVREFGAYGIRFVLSVNHINELHSKTRQEIDYKIAIQAKDKYEYSDILDVRTNYTIPNITGRGMCKMGDRTLEYHIAMTDAFEDEQTRTKLLKERLEVINNNYSNCVAAMVLPMAEGNEKYSDFCSYFDEDRIPLGYHLKTLKKVAMPLKQLSNLAMYFGNPLGVRPVFENMLCSAKRENMEVIIVKGNTDSIFNQYGKASNAIDVGEAEIFECTDEAINLLDRRIKDELAKRNVFRDRFCEENNIPRSDKKRVQKAYRYIKENTRPLLIIFECLADFSRLEKKNEEGRDELAGIKMAFQDVYFKRLKGYNIYFMAGFYPSDDDVSNSALIESFTSNQFSLVFGGCYDKQMIIKPNVSELYKVTKSDPKYDHFIMKYKEGLYGMRMPCGELIEETEDPDEASIV